MRTAGTRMHSPDLEQLMFTPGIMEGGGSLRGASHPVEYDSRGGGILVLLCRFEYLFFKLQVYVQWNG